MFGLNVGMSELNNRMFELNDEFSNQMFELTVWRIFVLNVPIE